MSRPQRENPAKRFLQRIEYYDAQIQAKMDERETVKSMVMRVTASMSLTPGGGRGGDKIGDGVSRLVDLEREIDAAIDRFVDLRRRATDLIERLDDPDEINVLHRKYVGRTDKDSGVTQYMTIDEIAEELHMSQRNVCYIHGRALQKVARMMEEEHDKGRD